MIIKNFRGWEQAVDFRVSDPDKCTDAIPFACSEDDRAVSRNQTDHALILSIISRRERTERQPARVLGAPATMVINPIQRFFDFATIGKFSLSSGRRARFAWQLRVRETVLHRYSNGAVVHSDFQRRFDFRM